MGEDVAQDVVGGDVADDVGEVVDALAEVFADEVAAQAESEAIDDAMDGVEGVGEGFVMTGVGDNDVGSADGGEGSGLKECTTKGVKTFACLRRDGDKVWRRNGMGGDKVRSHDGMGRDEVGLVQHADEGATLAARGNVGSKCGVLMIDGVIGRGCFGDIKNDLRLVNLLVGTGDAHLFDGVVGGTKACRVNKTEEHAIDDGGVVDDVARSTRNVGDDGTLIADEGVEKGALTNVGCSDNGHRDAVADGIAHTERLNETVDDSLYLVG